MAKNRKKRKTGSTQMSEKEYIRKVARKLPITICKINVDWKEAGMASISIARKKGNEDLVVGLYLVDIFFLGLKDTTYLGQMSDYEYESMLKDYEQSSGLNFIDVDPTLAQNIIYGAIEYAEDFGISPVNDFKLTEFILDDVESIEFVDVEFGKNGKPMLILGPNDDLKKIERVLIKEGLVIGKDIMLPE